MDLSCLKDDRNDCDVTSELVARRQPFCPVLLVAMDQISISDGKDRTGNQKKTCIWGFRPGLTQIGLYSHRS